MLVASLNDVDQEMPEPQGHTIGFIRSQEQCDAVVKDLLVAGIPGASITILSGDSGIRLFTRMMQGSLWGEAAENLLKDGVIALSHGDLVIMIEAENREQALLIAKAAEHHEGHGFVYFGELTDERLTK